MNDTTRTPNDRDGTAGLPRPRPGSRWRWSRRRQALVAGGALAAVLGLGVAAGTAAATGTGTGATSGNSGSATRGRPPAGMARPTVTGKVTALSGNTVTVETRAQRSVTVVTSSSTTYTSNPGPNGGTTSSAAALKVGDLIGVQGTRNADGTVTATTVVIGRPPQMGNGLPSRAGGGGTGSDPGNGAGAGAGTMPPAGAPSE